MTVQRSGPDRSVRLSCAVSFDGKNRFSRFETSGGGSSGSGGGTTKPAAPAGARPNAKVRCHGVRVTSDAGSSGRLVVLRVDGRKELLCLYRGRPALYRSV